MKKNQYENVVKVNKWQNSKSKSKLKNTEIF